MSENLQLCIKCGEFKYPDSFRKINKFFLGTWCKNCQINWKKLHPDKTNNIKSKLQRANRKARKLKATPAWTDKELIELIYAEATHRKLEVDHIIPLQGKNVCGLHVYYNMQLLTKFENIRKGALWP